MIAKKYAEYFAYNNLDTVFKTKVSKVSSKGIDKKSSDNFKLHKASELKIIERKTLSGNFQFSPYLEILRVKNRKSIPRLLSLPTIRDRIVLDVIKSILHEDFSDCVNRELPNSYIRKIKLFLEKNKTNNIYFLKTDIKKFYDKINREILLTELKKRISDEGFLNLVINTIQGIGSFRVFIIAPVIILLFFQKGFGVSKCRFQAHVYHIGFPRFGLCFYNRRFITNGIRYQHTFF
jgi:retron-type reverse transcriptase